MAQPNLLLLLFSGVITTCLSSSTPDIIFILSDDLGYGDYSLATELLPGSFRIPTPNIAKLAENGVQFHRGYSMQVCAPSRCTLMTGRHLGHCSIRGNDGAYSPLLKTDVSIAAVMKRAGYRTGIVGKWGLGNYGTTGYPLNQSFDYYVGQSTQVGCHDWYPLTVDNNTLPASVINTHAEIAKDTCLGASPTCTWANNLCKDQGIDFIRNSVHANQNYFLYVSTTTPHAGLINGDGKAPAWYSPDYPVPFEYSQAFLNLTGSSWNSQQHQFAAAVWAQDKIVGAVLDELEALNKLDSTIVFFSGDNGPDGHAFELMDDPGKFRGKKRSLHEGGIRQTIVAHWPGTITAKTSDTLFTFYDVLPTVADLAGLPRSQWGPTDGVSIKSVLLGQDPEPEALSRYIYFEYCNYGANDGLLPQTYEGGWVQAIRWDDNATAFRTEWKAIRTNSNMSTFLLYNITDDQSESNPMLSPTQTTCSPACVRAKEIVLGQMEEAHVENDFWPSVQKPGDKCCASCFNPAGCHSPCKQLGPPPPPAPPQPPISLSMLDGEWTGSNGKQYTLQIDTTTLTATISNPSDNTSCWTTGKGTVNANGTKIGGMVATGPDCQRTKVGAVRQAFVRKVIDVEYMYTAPALKISWTDVEQPTTVHRWPEWTKITGNFVIDFESI